MVVAMVLMEGVPYMVVAMVLVIMRTRRRGWSAPSAALHPHLVEGQGPGVNSHLVSHLVEGQGVGVNSHLVSHLVEGQGVVVHVHVVVTRRKGTWKVLGWCGMVPRVGWSRGRGCRGPGA